MFYLPSITLMHKNCRCTFIGLGAVLIGIAHVSRSSGQVSEG